MRQKFFFWSAACVLWIAASCALQMPRIAVVDRIVHDDHAVLLVGDPPALEVVAPVAELPAGVREGHWLWVELDDHRVAWAAIDEEATERAKARVRTKMEKLGERGRRGD